MIAFFEIAPICVIIGRVYGVAFIIDFGLALLLFLFHAINRLRLGLFSAVFRRLLFLAGFIFSKRFLFQFRGCIGPGHN